MFACAEIKKPQISGAIGNRSLAPLVFIDGAVVVNQRFAVWTHCNIMGRGGQQQLGRAPGRRDGIQLHAAVIGADQFGFWAAKAGGTEIDSAAISRKSVGHIILRVIRETARGVTRHGGDKDIKIAVALAGKGERFAVW